MVLTSKATSPGDWLKSRERSCVLLLCALAAIRVFVYSAAFPFFVLVDEEAHFDLVMRYSHAQIPHDLGLYSPDSIPFIAGCRTWEYLLKPEQLPTDALPPPWTMPPEKAQSRLATHAAAWRTAENHEALNPPLYYATAGLWLDGGRLLGFAGEYLLYWVRFLNVFIAAALVWLAFIAARLVFPERLFLRLGAPLLVAVLPQDTFYSIQSDVLSPLCYGIAFICLIRLLRTDNLPVGLSALSGLALTATVLVKSSNLPLLAISGAALLLHAASLWKTGKLRASSAGLGVLVPCTLLPLAAWSSWCFHVSGDLTGAAAKAKAIGWTLKPFSDWWSHPIFTPAGLWTFWSGLMATFWRGEFTWHGFNHKLASPFADTFYALSSLVLCGGAAFALTRNRPATEPARRQALFLALTGFLAGIVFLGFLSLLYDFHDCPYPSRIYPYFASGRLLSGSLIPFALLYMYGVDCLFSRFKTDWPRWLAMAAVVLICTASEIAITLPVFGSQYNWFHL